MVLCNVECVNKISEYLGLLSCKVYMSENDVVATDDLIKNQTIEGFSTIIQALLKKTENPAFLAGKDNVERALTGQWLEYAVLYLNYADTPGNGRRILKELNGALQGSTYICGTNLTIADVALYYALHSTMKGSSHREKARCIDVSRWYDNVQQNAKLRRTLDLINFDLLYLYQ